MVVFLIKEFFFPYLVTRKVLGCVLPQFDFFLNYILFKKNIIFNKFSRIKKKKKKTKKLKKLKQCSFLTLDNQPI